MFYIVSQGMSGLLHLQSQKHAFKMFMGHHVDVSTQGENISAHLLLTRLHRQQGWLIASAGQSVLNCL